MTLNILVADDDPQVRMLLQLTFEREGWRIDTAQNGAVTLELLKQGDYDFLMLDLSMPRIDGEEVLRQAKSIAPGTKIIVITAYPSESAMIEAIRSTAVDFITKPFFPDALIAQIKELSSTLTVGKLNLDTITKIITFDGKTIDGITKHQRRLLEVFLRNPTQAHDYVALANVTLKRDDDEAWDIEDARKALHSHMSRLRTALRKAVGSDVISSHRHGGFRLLIK